MFNVQNVYDRVKGLIYDETDYWNIFNRSFLLNTTIKECVVYWGKIHKKMLLQDNDNHFEKKKIQSYFHIPSRNFYTE